MVWDRAGLQLILAPVWEYPPPHLWPVSKWVDWGIDAGKFSGRELVREHGSSRGVLGNKATIWDMKVQTQGRQDTHLFGP